MAGTDTEFKPDQRMIVEPHQMHGYRNDTSAQPATIRVAAAPAGGLDPILRTLSGLSHEGLLGPGKPPCLPCYGESGLAQPLLSAAASQMALLDDDRAMAPLGARACDRLMGSIQRRCAFGRSTTLIADQAWTDLDVPIRLPQGEP